MKRLLLIIIIFTFLLVGCQSAQTIPEQNPSLNPDRNANNPDLATEPTRTDTALTQENDEESNLPAEPNFAAYDLSALSLSPPTGWFYTQNTVDTISAVIYTNHNPEQIQMDKSLTQIPTDFAVGALVLSPLPEESDPDAMRAGLESILESYGAQDMEAMLYITNQIGVLDITNVESVEFVLAQIDVLGGHEALFMDGNINLQGSDQLHVHIWLTWTQTSFVSLFEFAKVETWSSVEETFSQARSTILIP